WLMVSVEDEDAPVVWRIIQEGWFIACDERSMTMNMQQPCGNGHMVLIQKLRFSTRQEYWSFVAHFASSRVQAYAAPWGEAGFAVPVYQGGVDATQTVT
ncbi:hypothetical protein C8Q76DRAFT_632916, partial [Earliella scabrosa]